ncbi:MAG: hypothetical protein IKU43_04985 [Clostridia bacterium]|nr:hypothetical protein [Clostridia bacterium]
MKKTFFTLVVSLIISTLFVMCTYAKAPSDFLPSASDIKEFYFSVLDLNYISADGKRTSYNFGYTTDNTESIAVCIDAMKNVNLTVTTENLYPVSGAAWCYVQVKDKNGKESKFSIALETIKDDSCGYILTHNNESYVVEFSELVTMAEGIYCVYRGELSESIAERVGFESHASLGLGTHRFVPGECDVVKIEYSASWGQGIPKNPTPEYYKQNMKFTLTDEDKIESFCLNFNSIPFYEKGETVFPSGGDFEALVIKFTTADGKVHTLTKIPGTYCFDYNGITYECEEKFYNHLIDFAHDKFADATTETEASESNDFSDIVVIISVIKKLFTLFLK